MQLPTTFEGLIIEISKRGLYEKLILQLNKDLALANIDLGFDEEVLPTSLKLILQESIYK